MLFLITSILFTSCVEESEAPIIQSTENGQLMKVKAWFEENEPNLRLAERGSNLKTKSKGLVLPFFAKKPDWNKFHHYFLPDGREVFEVNLKNSNKYFPKSMLESFPNGKAEEEVIQNIMFVKNPFQNRFDPLIVRYYPENMENAKEFKKISFQGMPFDWSGTVDIWTYDEHHFIGFNFKDGELINNFRYNQNRDENARVTGDCYTIVREIDNNYVDENGPVVMPTTYVSETFFTGSGGYNPTGGQGSGDDGEWHEYERPECCDDPVPVPETGLPTYDPPTIPSPITIINDLKNPCAVDIFKELSKGSTYITDLSGISGLDIFPGMLDLFETSGKFDYRIRNADLSGQNAVTNRVNKVNIITIDNTYLKNATSLSIARTMIHETVHAYLWEQTKVQTDKTSLELLNIYWEKYKDSGDGRWPNTQHGAMSNFILGIAVSLYNWDKKFGPTGGNLEFEYYYKMAFGGLVKKDNPTQLMDEAKPYLPSGTSWGEILNLIDKEKSGNYEAKGEKCD